jgi:hypothetical protein
MMELWILGVLGGASIAVFLTTGAIAIGLSTLLDPRPRDDE